MYVEESWMYKDKDKQREANRKATQRYRAKKGDSALLGHKDGLKNARGLPVVDEVSDTHPVIPSCDTPDVIPKRTPKGNIRVSKPGDADYLRPVPAQNVISLVKAVCKRGKDIKCFADLPRDVQQTINEISDTPEEKANRTAIAINYQHIFPESYGQGSNADFTELLTQAGPDYNGICTPEWRAARGR